MYPNTGVLLGIGCTLPVSFAEAELLSFILWLATNQVISQKQDVWWVVVRTCTHALTSWPWNSYWQNLYNLCYRAPKEDIPRVHLLRVDFKYTVRGQGIITCIATAGRGCGVVGASNLPQNLSLKLAKRKKTIFSLSWTSISWHGSLRTWWNNESLRIFSDGNLKNAKQLKTERKTWNLYGLGFSNSIRSETFSFLIRVIFQLHIHFTDLLGKRCCNCTILH